MSNITPLCMMPDDVLSLFSGAPNVVDPAELFEKTFPVETQEHSLRTGLKLALTGKAAKMVDLLIENADPYIGESGQRAGLKYEVMQYNCVTAIGNKCDITDQTMNTVKKPVHFDFSRDRIRTLSYAIDNGHFSAAPVVKASVREVLGSNGADIKKLGQTLGWFMPNRPSRDRDGPADGGEEQVRYYATAAKNFTSQSNYCERVFNGWCMYYHSLLVQEYGIEGPMVSSILPTKLRMIKSTAVDQVLAEYNRDPDVAFLYVGGIENLEMIACMVLCGRD